MAEPLVAVAEPVSETMATPLGAKATEKVPGAGLGLTTMGERVPSGWTVEDVDVVGDALGDDEELAVGAEGERCAASGGCGEEDGGVFDLLELTAEVDVEADEAAGAAAVENVDEALVLGDGRGLCAAGFGLVEEGEVGVVNAEDGDVAAAGVDGEEKGVVLAKGERALRLEWISDASAAAAIGVEGDAVAEGAVGGAFEGDDFVFVGGVGHDEDGASGVFGLGRGESWECGANSDGEHQETSSYLQHLQLLGKTDRARPRRGVE